MSIGSVIRGVASGVGKAGKVVGNDLRAALEPAPEQPVTPAAMINTAQQSPSPQPFQLPDLDPSDPDYEEKKAVHDAYTRLAAMHDEWTKEAGDPYMQQYQDLQKYVASRPSPKRFSPLSAFAIAMGNPAAAERVAQTNSSADDEMRRREDYLLGLKEKALQGHIQKLLDEGNFRQALTQSAALADLNATQQRIADKRKADAAIALAQEQNKGRTAAAQIRADSAVKVAERRLQAYGQQLGLTREQIRAEATMFAAQVRALSTQKNMMGESMISEDDYANLEAMYHHRLETLADSNGGGTHSGGTGGGTPPAGGHVQPAAPGQSQMSPRAAAVLAARARAKSTQTK